MKYNSHLIGSSVVAVSTPFIAKEIGLHLSLGDFILIIPAIIMGGIFPDCDIKSKAQKYYGIALLFLGACWSIMGTFEYIFIPLAPFLLAVISKHRGWTHSWFLPLGLMLLPWLIFKTTINSLNYQHLAYFMFEYKTIFTSFAVGLMVHLVLDVKRLKKIVRFVGGNKLVEILYG